MADSTTVNSSSWQEVVKKAQELRDASITRVEPPVPDVPAELSLDVTDIPKLLLSTEEVLITQTVPEDLVVSLASGRLTSEAVVTAFLRRAGLAQKLVCNSIQTKVLSADLSRPIVLPSCFLREP